MPMWKRLLSIALLSSCLSISLALYLRLFSDAQQGSLSRGFQVCEGHEESTFELRKLSVHPQPVRPGDTLTIYAEGTLKKEIKDGSLLHVDARYIGIQIVNRDLDFCKEAAPEVGRQCPVEPGEVVIDKQVEIPSSLPDVS